MTDVSSRATAISRRHHIPVSGICVLLIGIGAVGVSSSADATPTPLTVAGPFLYYVNQGPSTLFGGGGDYIAYGADTVVPNGAAGTTGSFTSSTQSGPINFIPDPVDQNLFYSQRLLSSFNNSDLTNPWTITFQNTGTTPTKVPNMLSLFGPGEIPVAQSVTLSGTGANPTFSWSAPAGLIADGYRIQIFQNSPNIGAIIAANLTQPTYTVQGSLLQLNTTYTIETEILTTKNGSTTNLSNNNLSASSRVYSTFQILPVGAPGPVNLPTVTVSGGQVIFGFNLTVQPGITYYIDP
jgi:hypothetical protein